jgi:catechol 2,3-dioxygenase-like lactoylglutathione lyase family enzyme
MELEALDHVGLNVADIARSIDFYAEVLGLRRAYEDAWGDYPAVLEAAGAGVALFPSDAPPAALSKQGADDMGHVGFRTSRPGLQRARDEVRARSIPFHEGDYGVAWSIYFDDPDGNQIEIVTYEPPE